MDPVTILVMANAVTLLAEKLVPMIRDAFANGDIPASQQAEVRAKYEALRAVGGEAFSGPEYELSGR